MVIEHSSVVEKGQTALPQDEEGLCTCLGERLPHPFQIGRLEAYGLLKVLSSGYQTGVRQHGRIITSSLAAWSIVRFVFTV